jgi:hypothetical protein
MSQIGIHYRVWGYYNPASGKGEYAIYEMNGNQIVTKLVNGLSWSSDEWHKAQAVCKKLNQDQSVKERISSGSK